MHNPLIVALDLPDATAALRLAASVGPWVGAVKVGFELFTAAGPDLIRGMRASGARVFLDLKLHDIPHTVAKAVAVATRLDVQMLTVHASGGPTMLKAAVESARETALAFNRPPPLLLGVTVLTSMDDQELAQITLESSVPRQVERLARLAVDSGLGGLVCSPLELPVLRPVLPGEVQLVTPGIRSGPPRPGDDQKRTMGPAEAIAAGADWLVVGRPIYAAADPLAATRSILAALNLESQVESTIPRRL